VEKGYHELASKVNAASLRTLSRRLGNERFHAFARRQEGHDRDRDCQCQKAREHPQTHGAKDAAKESTIVFCRHGESLLLSSNLDCGADEIKQQPKCERSQEDQPKDKKQRLPVSPSPIAILLA
jgi:hypothetical protein